MIKFFCTNCGQKLAVQEMQVGGKVLCPSCGDQQRIPEQQVAVPRETPPAQQNAGLRPVSDSIRTPAPHYSVGFREKEDAEAKDAAAQLRSIPEPPAVGTPAQACPHGSDLLDGAAPLPEYGLRPIPRPPPAGGLRAISEIKQTLQSSIDRSSRTISQFMAEKKIEGAIDLTATDDPSSAQNILTADQGRKYVLGDVVAKGGMGAIIDAKDANLRRTVAMKVTLDPRHTARDNILRFIQEAQVTGQLEHPNIVPLHELGVDASGNVFYTMKFVRGVTLHDVLSGLRKNDPETVRNYSLARLLNIFQKVCDAIAFAHSKRVIHRDLKPENVMLGNFGEVLVMDWGLARVSPKKELQPRHRFRIKGKAPPPKPPPPPSTSPSIHCARRDFGQNDVFRTMDGAIMGTPGFMAPEQAMGDLEAMGPCTDIYALGAILYAILTLQPPIKGKDISEVLRKVTTGDIPPPTSFNPTSGRKGKVEGGNLKPEREQKPESGTSGFKAQVSSLSSLPHLPSNLVPDSLSAVAMKALALEPYRRYSTVQDLQKEIEAYQGGFATNAEHAGLWRQTLLFLKRHRTVTALGLFATTAMIGGSIVSTKQWMTAAKERNAAREALAALKNTSPALIAQARRLIQQGDISNAVKQAVAAAKLMPNSPKYQIIKGDMLECALRIRSATEAYERAMELLEKQGVDGSDPAADGTSLLRHTQENLELCRKILAEARDEKLSVAAVSEIYVAMRNQDRFDESLAVLQFLGKDLKTLEPMYRDILDKRGVKYTSLMVDRNGRCNLTVASAGISDLNLLKGLPLASLNLQDGAPIATLAPLKGMALTTLNLPNAGQITNLSPLAGMPLTALNLDRCSMITDLSPLRGMPLTSLNLAECGQITNLLPLRGMKLTSLILDRCGKITDLSPLKGMPLKSLVLGNLNRTGVPVPVSDISPLEGMLLQSLNLGRTKVSDLSPLKGMSLWTLNVEETPVSDLSPLKGMPLRSLGIGWCAKITDLSPLRGMKTLTQLPNTDPWPIVNKPLMQAVLAKNAEQANAIAKQLVSDWSDVPAMASVVRNTRPWFDTFIPLMKNPDASLAGTKTFGGHHYYFWPTPMPWVAARQFCESVGGHLVTITSKEEHALVMQLAAPDRKIHCHIGLTKEGTAAKWITGEPWVETTFARLTTDEGSCGGVLISNLGSKKPGELFLLGECDRVFVIEWDR